MRVSVAFSSCMHFLTMSRVLDSGDKYRGTPPTANAQTGANQATRRYPAEGTRIASVSALSTSMRVNPDSPTLTEAEGPSTWPPTNKSSRSRSGILGSFGLDRSYEASEGQSVL